MNRLILGLSLTMLGLSLTATTSGHPATEIFADGRFGGLSPAVGRVVVRNRPLDVPK